MTHIYAAHKGPNKGPTQTESEGLLTNIPRKWTGKKNTTQQGSNTHIRQNRLQNKGPKKRPRRSLHTN